MVNNIIYYVGLAVCILVMLAVAFIVTVVLIAAVRVLLKKDSLSQVEKRSIKVNPSEKERVQESVVAVITGPSGEKKIIQKKPWFKFW
jgi:hypothetical protein